MNTNNQFILSGKYEVLDTLGYGSFSTVYLARHQSLESERAIKIIPKNSSSQLSVLSEARLLKSLKHPGIPMIYDIEEDDKNYYLVEEYIRGDSLEAYLLHQTFISQNQFFTFCEQLCDIFIYLHTAMPSPILYQDLKPEHIIVCGNQVKLIDFGVSSYVTSLGNNFKQYGNVGFSAPESFAEENLSVLADVYSIGKMMHYLSTYVNPPLSHSIQHMIQKATETEAGLRYETVEALLSEIHKEFSQTGQPHLLQSIAVIGSFSGCGATHFALSLVSTLNFLGYDACYFEANNTDSMRKMYAYQKKMWEKDGCLYYKNFCGYPRYGPGIQVPEPKNVIRVTDYGSLPEEDSFSHADLILFLCTDALWRRADAIDKNDFLHQYRERMKIICNPGDHSSANFYANRLSLPIYSYFYDSDPFRITKEKASFVSQLLFQKGRSGIFSTLKRRVSRLRRPSGSVE